MESPLGNVLMHVLVIHVAIVLDLWVALIEKFVQKIPDRRLDQTQPDQSDESPDLGPVPVAGVDAEPWGQPEKTKFLLEIYAPLLAAFQHRLYTLVHSK